MQITRRRLIQFDQTTARLSYLRCATEPSKMACDRWGKGSRVPRQMSSSQPARSQGENDTAVRRPHLAGGNFGGNVCLSIRKLRGISVGCGDNSIGGGPTTLTSTEVAIAISPHLGAGRTYLNAQATTCIGMRPLSQRRIGCFHLRSPSSSGRCISTRPNGRNATSFSCSFCIHPFGWPPTFDRSTLSRFI